MGPQRSNREGPVKRPRTRKVHLNCGTYCKEPLFTVTFNLFRWSINFHHRNFSLLSSLYKFYFLIIHFYIFPLRWWGEALCDDSKKLFQTKIKQRPDQMVSTFVERCWDHAVSNGFDISRTKEMLRQRGCQTATISALDKCWENFETNSETVLSGLNKLSMYFVAPRKCIQM